MPCLTDAHGRPSLSEWRRNGLRRGSKGEVQKGMGGEEEAEAVIRL